jgi:hypothetical protein
VFLKISKAVRQMISSGVLHHEVSDACIKGDAAGGRGEAAVAQQALNPEMTLRLIEHDDNSKNIHRHLPVQREHSHMRVVSPLGRSPVAISAAVA